MGGWGKGVTEQLGKIKLGHEHPQVAIDSLIWFPQKQHMKPDASLQFIWKGIQEIMQERGV